MDKHGTSLEALLQGLESEAQTADGHTVRLCRDPVGQYWVVDGERVISLGEFASGSSARWNARPCCAASQRWRGISWYGLPRDCTEATRSPRGRSTR
jgi:hypothetical protein